MQKKKLFQDFQEILKRMLQNFQEILKKCLPVTYYGG